MPRIVVGLPVMLSNDPDAAKATAAEQFANYARLPSYRSMLDVEGAAMPEDVALLGNEEQIETSSANSATPAQPTSSESPSAQQKNDPEPRSSSAHLPQPSETALNNSPPGKEALAVSHLPAASGPLSLRRPARKSCLGSVERHEAGSAVGPRRGIRVRASGERAGRRLTVEPARGAAATGQRGFRRSSGCAAGRPGGGCRPCT